MPRTKRISIFVGTVLLLVLIHSRLLFPQAFATATPSPTVLPTETLPPTPTTVPGTDVITGFLVTRYEVAFPIEPASCDDPVQRITAYQDADLRGIKWDLFPGPDGITVIEHGKLGDGYPDETNATAMMVIGQQGMRMTRLTVVQCGTGLAIAQLDSVENPLAAKENGEYRSCSVDIGNSASLDNLKTSMGLWDYRHATGEIYLHIRTTETIDGVRYDTYYIVELYELSGGYTVWSMGEGKSLLIYRRHDSAAIGVAPTDQIASLCE